MIIATETPDHHFVVETSAAINGKKQRLTVASHAEAHRIAQIWNRLYIFEKLTSWLLQRAFAFRLANMEASWSITLELLRELRNYDRHSLNHVCAWVVKNEKQLTGLAPGEKSKHYKFYQNTIITILEFCREMKGVVQ